MSNPFYNKPTSPIGNAPNFVQFMNAMKGRNPNEILNNMIRSGNINQNQLNQIQEKAKQMSGQFEAFRSMFGFYRRKPNKYIKEKTENEHHSE